MMTNQPSSPMSDAPDEDRMEKISALIARLQSTLEQWGDTCVYIRRGGLSWGAVALNRQADDKNHGVFDLQSQHDRDMVARLEQIERLIKSKNEWMDRAIKAEDAAAQSSAETVVPLDHVVVPREPTKEMIQACIWALDRWREKHGNVQGHVPPGEKYQIRWRAMIAAYEAANRPVG